jgi:hypothetical protein
MMALSSPMGSRTPASFAAVNGARSNGAACWARTAVPDTVLTHPESTTEAAMTAPTVALRVAAPITITALL